MTAPRLIIRAADAAAHAAIVADLNECRDLQRKMRAEPHNHTSRFMMLEAEFDTLASEIVDDLLAAAVVDDAVQPPNDS